MGEKDWKDIWEQFDWVLEDINEGFQNEMVAKHGEGFYHIDGDEYWGRQKELIRKLVEAKLKEKNT